MKVKDLIKELEEFDLELDVLIANEENKIIGIKTLARFFEISYVSFLFIQRHKEMIWKEMLNLPLNRTGFVGDFFI